MKHQKKIKKLLLFSFTVAVFSSCIDKNYDLSNISDEGAFTPSLPAPLGSFQKSVADILSDLGIGQDDRVVTTDNSIYIVYADTFQFSSNNDNMLPMLDVSLPINFISNAMVNREFTFDIPIPADSWSDALDSVQLVNSEIKIQVKESKLSTPARFELSFPDGVKFEEENSRIEIPAGANNSSYTLKLKDHSIFKLEKQQDKYLLRISVQLKVDETEILTPLNNIDLVISFSKFDIEIAWGEFSQITFDPIIGEHYVGVFNGLAENGSLLSFSNPTVVCDLYNHVGVGGTFKIDSLKTFSEKTGVIHEAEFETGKKSYSISLNPAQSPSQPSAPKNIIFDKNNGAIDRLFFQEEHPDHIRYNFSFDVENHSGFLVVKDNKYIDVVLEVRLPLTFNDGTRFNNRDTLDVDLSGNSTIKDVENLILWIDYKNRFGVNIGLEVLFLDKNRNNIASLSNSYEIESADVGTNRTDVQPKQGTIEIEFDKSKLSDLQKTRYIVLATSVANTSGMEVSIHPQDCLNITLSAFSSIEVKL
jgi:hypothetical protein